MSALAYSVCVTDPDGQPVWFGPDSADVPGWATKQMGDHCFVDGERPDTADEGYGSWKVAALKAEVDKRNANRAEGDEIDPESGKKADLVAALEADDTAHQ